MAYDLQDAVTVQQLKKSAQKAYDKAEAIREELNNKMTSVHKYKGSIASAALTSALLVKANECNVYNVTDAFTTTADFVEGAGKKHTAGTNVSIIEATAAVYTVSEDTTVNAGKTYYISQNGGYSAVTPAGNENPATEGWYELTTPSTYKFDVHGGDLSGVQVLTPPTAAGNFAGLDANGKLVDLKFTIATDEEVDEMLAEIYGN